MSGARDRAGRARRAVRTGWRSSGRRRRNTTWSGWRGATVRKRSSAASRRSWGSRWWSCPPARGTTSPSTSDLDRDDVVGALDAFGDAVERPMDLADVNGKVFVNNVSLGLYAAIVRSPEYRDAKVGYHAGGAPEGPGSRTNLRPAVRRPDGHHDGAHVIQVSNNPYGDTLAALGSRPRLDTRPIRGRVAGHRWRPGAERGSSPPWRPVGPHRSRGSHLVGADLRGLIGSADRGRARRRDPGDGLPAPVLHQARSGQGPTAQVRDRLLAGRSFARLGGIVGRSVGGAPGKAWASRCMTRSKCR